MADIGGLRALELLEALPFVAVDLAEAIVAAVARQSLATSSQSDWPAPAHLPPNSSP